MHTETIILPVPIMRGEKEIKEIELQEPTVLSLQGLETMGIIRGDVAQLCVLLPRISDLSSAETKSLCFKNLAAISMRVTSFLG